MLALDFAWLGAASELLVETSGHDAPICESLRHRCIVSFRACYTSFVNFDRKANISWRTTITSLWARV